MLVAPHYFHRILLGHDLIQPRLDTWELLYQLVLNTLNDGGFQLDAVGHILFSSNLLKFMIQSEKGKARGENRITETG